MIETFTNLSTMASYSNRLPEWMQGMNDNTLMEMMLAATAPIDNPVNARPADQAMVDCGIEVGNLTSMCFWLCVARALDIDAVFVVDAMGIDHSHPASDDEIRMFIGVFPAAITVYEPGETRQYDSVLPEAQRIELWLEHGHYRLIRR